MQATFYNPVKIHSTERTADELPTVLSSLSLPSSPILLVTDHGLAKYAFVQEIETSLRASGLAVVPFADIRAEPWAGEVDAAAELARNQEACCVVGIGGGSALDVAKMTACLATVDAPVNDYAFGRQELPETRLPCVCIPTTAGTGSEVTRTAIYRDENQTKAWVWGDVLWPDWAVLDASLTLSLPPQHTIATGLDALVHALEACTNRHAHELSNALCFRAIELIRENLVPAVQQPKDIAAREKMLVAACLAGCGIDAAGVAVAHAFGHALATLVEISHGQAVAVSLRACLPWMAAHDVTRFVQPAKAFGIPCAGQKPEDIVAELCRQYTEFAKEAGLSFALGTLGLDVRQAQRLADAVMSPANEAMRNSTLRELTASDALELSKQMLSFT